MNDNDLGRLSGPALDDALEQALGALPPSAEIVRAVTPWRRAMRRILIGFALCGVTLNFLALQYILPAAGLILQLLGFRALRREGGCFRAGFLLAALRLGVVFPQLAINATVWQQDFADTRPAALLTALALAAQLAQALCLYGGLRAVRRKAGLRPGAGAAAALILWYAAIALLSARGYSGLLFGLPLAAIYGLLLWSLHRADRALDDAGYAVAAAPVRLSDRALALLLAALLLLGVAAGYLFFSRLPMDWSAAPAARADTAAVRGQLQALGFPEAALADLSDADVRACRGALRVTAVVRDHPVNEGRQVTTRSPAGSVTDTVYDRRELRLSSVAVALPDGCWRIFHHFFWIAAPGFRGTEALQLWPACRGGMGWTLDGDWTGRVLCDRGGAALAAPFRRLGSRSYESGSFFGGASAHSDVFAEFSFPRGAVRCRGYVAYTVAASAPGCIIDSWVNYVHQRSALQYPVQTAAGFRMRSGMFASRRVFFTVQDALQFDPADPSAALLG